MDSTTYTQEKYPPQALIDLIQKKYGAQKNFDYFFSEYSKAWDFCFQNENIVFVPIAVYKNTEMMAHCALIVDKRLPTGEALFGFFEVQNDLTVFNALWERIVEEAKNRSITKLKGPVNGSIWHQYRCIKETDGSDFFKSELCSETYYYEVLKSIQPLSEIEYHSGFRERFQAILQAGQAAFNQLGSYGFRVTEMESNSLEKLQTIASLSRTVFKNNWGYVELNQQEFLKLYSTDKLGSHSTKIYLLYKGDAIIGFCGVFMEDEQTLICKTIAVLPEYQGLGLGNALAYKVHMDAEEQGIKKIIYALIRADNNIKNFTKDDAVVFRKYAAFEYAIPQ